MHGSQYSRTPFFVISIRHRTYSFANRLNIILSWCTNAYSLSLLFELTLPSSTMLVKKQFPSELPLVLSLTLAFNTWYPSKLEVFYLCHHKSLPLVNFDTSAMHTHYAHPLCTLFICIMHFSYSCDIPSQLYTFEVLEIPSQYFLSSFLCRREIEDTSQYYFVFFRNRWYPVLSSFIIRNRRYLCAVFLTNRRYG